MMSILLLIQYFSLFILIVELFYVIHQKPSRLQNILIIVMTMTLINFVGYTLEMKSVNMREALCAVKITYLGKPFIALSTFFFIMEYFHLKISKITMAVLSMIHVGIACLVFFCEYHHLFYSKIEFTQSGIYPHLVLEHGIVYNIYTLLLVFYLIAIIVVCAKQFPYVDGKNAKMRIICLESISFISVSTYIVYLTGITGGYDITALGYIISSTLLFVTMLRYKLFDALTLAKDDISDEMAQGLIVIDKMNQIIYFNNKSKNIFPDIGTKMDEKIVSRLKNLCDEKENLKRSNCIYEILAKDIIRNKEYYGKTFVIQDITESYYHTEKLEKQRLIAEKANKAKSDFLARMSHEIRTPINSVLGMSEMILRESKEEDIKLYASQVKSSTRYLLGLVNDILDSSKIESGKMEIINVDYHLDDFLGNLENMMGNRAKEKGLELKFQVDPTIPNHLRGDDVRIRQILINLLSNAVKYTENGMVTLSVTGNQDGEYINLHYEVKDTGRGIKQEDLSKLFATYERVDETKNRSIEGTGLGLNIVSNLLKLMGSRIRVVSEYGKGSCFFFDIRQRIVETQSIGVYEPRAQQSIEKAKELSYIAPDARVLVVDDNEMNRFVFRSLLKPTQIKIDEADSGKQCMELVRHTHYDMIFMDHMMPEMDGVETFHRMKEDVTCFVQDVPIVILTANAVPGAKEEYLKLGFDGYLSKPLEPEEIDIILYEKLPQYLIQAM